MMSRTTTTAPDAPGSWACDQWGSYRLLGNTLSRNTYRTACEYATRQIEMQRAEGRQG